MYSHVIINISGDITLFDANDAASYIEELTGENCNTIFGAVVDPSMEEKVKITVIATGLDEERNVVPSFTKTAVPKTNFATKEGQVASSVQKTVSAPSMQKPAAPVSPGAAPITDRHLTMVRSRYRYFYRERNNTCRLGLSVGEPRVFSYMGNICNKWEMKGKMFILPFILSGRKQEMDKQEKETSRKESLERKTVTDQKNPAAPGSLADQAAGSVTAAALKKLRVSAVFSGYTDDIAGSICCSVCGIHALYDHSGSLCIVCAGRNQGRSVHVAAAVHQ